MYDINLAAMVDVDGPDLLVLEGGGPILQGEDDQEALTGLVLR